MRQQERTSPLAGSALPAHLLKARTGAADPEQRLRVTLRLAARGGDQALLDAAMRLGGQMPAARRHLPRPSLAAAFGPSPEAAKAVAAFCDDHSLELQRSALGGLFVTVAGRAQDLGRAFGVELGLYRMGGHLLRAYEGALRLPAELAPHVAAVLGLDEVSRLAAGRRAGMEYTEPPSIPGNLPTTVAFDYYQYPQGVTGKGAIVAFMESDLVVDLAAIQAFFASLGLPPVTIVLERPDAASADGDTPTLNGEAMMDLKLVGAVAPGATLVGYSLAQSYGYSSDPWIDALVAALDNDTDPCNVMSISLGQPESNWSEQTALAVHVLFAIAGLLGVTVCVASGDYGAPGNPDGAYAQNCAFPASSSYCLACGGTELLLQDQGGARVLTGEVVWNEMQAPGEKRATGGGISTLFTVPEYQQGITLPPPFNPGQPAGRGMPDVAGNAASRSGYALSPQGTGDGFGTSAAAPIWAALAALLVERNAGQAIGFLTPLLYAQQGAGAACCTPILNGNNGPPPGLDGQMTPYACYPAGAPWNACCGLGSPLGNGIAAELGLGATAGTAATAS
ncbi:S53 family peptidase [Neoroseomonas lacus]|uniref:Kumamolisin n=1 Tax=Neoroseomonas lacus TaxID=287609 RepID=A0A917K5G4_9PROT|nr:S53 family peptidase [Neoroseomonas lacus]GGI99764.1 kumamolisin [Neoroseomonas lacus]